ncbi:MAG: phosphoenolpyruvate--protein phosphotransferase, partial [Acidimicrobiia bacterium]|nr:phosphoenolpyruvate--protein phosphotransferase [Acidimicrobiia bacterium]
MRLDGAPASPGVVVGPAFVVTRPDIDIPDTDTPKETFAAAAKSVAADLKELEASALAAGRDEASAVLGAQALMAEDPMLGDAVNEALDAGKGLQGAVEDAAGALSAMLAAMEDEYLAARSADVIEVADRVLLRLAGVEDVALADLAAPSVVVAASLTAAQTAQMEADLVMAFVTEQGGPTGHVAVIARSLGIPAVVGAPGAVAAVAVSGTTVGGDGGTGEVIVDPDSSQVDDFTVRAARYSREREEAAAYRGAQVTFGGDAFEVASNIGSTDDIERAVSEGADGVGLFRTEFLFLDRPDPPTEEE